MTFNKHNPLSLKSWKLLESHFRKNAQKQITDYFSEDSDRVKKLSLQWESFYVDYSKNLLDKETLDLLLALAEESGLNQAICDYFEGKKINETENRAVLHTALRQLNPRIIMVDGQNITPKIEEAKCKCASYNGRLATESEIVDAYNNGANWCTYGWTDGVKAFYPVQKEFYDINIMNFQY